MRRLLYRHILMACLSLYGVTVSATPADDDLRLAAMAHKAGETQRAVAIWRSWADQGNVDAAYNLAVIHQYGDGVPLDYAKALQWYRQAAEQGDKVSQLQIGLMYQTGQGVVADETEAHRWFTMHRRHHLHHAHEPKMLAWRQQARALIDERDRREQLAASRATSVQVLAELKRRAGLSAEPPLATAALAGSMRVR